MTLKTQQFQSMFLKNLIQRKSELICDIFIGGKKMKFLRNILVKLFQAGSHKSEHSFSIPWWTRGIWSSPCKDTVEKDFYLNFLFHTVIEIKKSPQKDAWYRDPFF